MGSIDFAKFYLSFALIRQEVASFIKNDLWKSLCTRVFVPVWQGTLTRRNIVVLSGAAAATFAVVFVFKKYAKAPSEIDDQDALLRTNTPTRRASESSTISELDNSPHLQEAESLSSPDGSSTPTEEVADDFLRSFPSIDESPTPTSDQQLESSHNSENFPIDGTGSTATDQHSNTDQQAAEGDSTPLTASLFIPDNDRPRSHSDDVQFATAELLAAGVAAIKASDQLLSSPQPLSNEEKHQKAQKARILAAFAIAAFAFIGGRARL